MNGRIRVAAIAVVLCLSGPASGTDWQTSLFDNCRGPPDPDETLHLVAVAADAVTPTTVPDCDPAGSECLTTPVPRGTKGLLKLWAHEWSCVDLFTPAGIISGWVRARALVPDKNEPPANPRLTDWAGTWFYDDNKIRISVYRGTLWAYGNAYWPERKDWHALGLFEGRARPQGNVLRISEGPASLYCEVRLKLMTPYLVVSDNFNCAGVNAHFDGVYIRASRAIRP